MLQCLYDAGKYGKISLLDLLCEALNPEVWKSRVSDNCKKKTEDSAQRPSAECSLHTLRSRGYIAQALYKVRYACFYLLLYAMGEVYLVASHFNLLIWRIFCFEAYFTVNPTLDSFICN